MTPVETYHNDTSNQDKYWAKWKKCTEKRVKKNKKYYHPKHGLIHPQDGLAFSTESKCRSHYKKYEKHKAKAVASGTKVEEKGITVAGSTYEDSGTSGKTVYKKPLATAAKKLRLARYREDHWRTRPDGQADSFEEQEEEEFLLTDDADDAIDKKKGKKKNGKKKYVALAVAGLVVVGGVFWFASKSS
jgi:hypothetical protein